MSDRPMAHVAREVLLSGRVQGVGFRWYAEERARSLDVSGWIRNLPDGRVAAWVEGEPPAVDSMLRWLAEGPPSARVDGVDARERDPEGHPGFRVRG